MAVNRDHDLIPSSPSNSSLSSSDLDTESTGSFFPDRSTSLGTLMGVSFPDLPAPRPARRDRHGADAGAGGRRPRPREAERRRRSRGGGRGWWRLCRDDAAAPTSLGEFLQVERRIGGGAVDGDYVYGGGGGGGPGAADYEAVGGGPLFEDGRILPPPAAAPADGRRRGQQRAAEGSVGRWPVLLTGICSGGEA